MKISFQPQQPDRNYNKTDSIPETIPTANGFMIRVKRKQQKPQQQDFLKDVTPGTTEREEVYGGKKVKITSTTTVEKVGENTVIKIVEESKYHTSTKTRIIHPDGSQELRSDGKNKVKTCKMPEGFAQKYLSTQVKIGSISE